MNPPEREWNLGDLPPLPSVPDECYPPGAKSVPPALSSADTVWIRLSAAAWLFSAGLSFGLALAGWGTVVTALAVVHGTGVFVLGLFALREVAREASRATYRALDGDRS